MKASYRTRLIVAEPDSWTPKEAFEEAYQSPESMSFGHALCALQGGHKVARRGWNGKGIFIELQVPDENSKMTHPYIYIDTTGLESYNLNAPRERVPWVASQIDMLSNDWRIVE